MSNRGEKLKTLAKYVIGITLLIGLSACVSVESRKEKVAVSGISSNASATQATDDAYRMLIIDGKYPVSHSRGASLVIGGSAANVSEFETGLMQLSKSVYPTSQYFFSEGQFISKEDITKWLARQSDKNVDGLNSADDGTGRKNDIISQILEQDYMLVSDATYVLGGLSIGIALNPTIQYENNGVVRTDSLTDDELLATGKEAANKIVEKLRAREGFGSTPILISLFKQGEAGSLDSGVYLVSATSKEGVTLSDWTATRIEKRLFPLEVDKTEDIRAFSEFKTNISAFFPNLNGVVAQATYYDKSLSELVITITTQFYGQAEMIAFSQYLVEQAGQYFTTDMPIKIVVESVRGTEAVIFKTKATNTFQSIILH